MKRNILLLTIIIAISVLFSTPFGILIDKYMFSSSVGFATFSLDNSFAFIDGFVYLFIFLSPLLFGIFGLTQKYVWSVCTIAPFLYVFYYLDAGEEIWFWSLAFFIMGFLISSVINLLTKNKN